MSNPGTIHPDGTEYIIPLCKTDAGSFMFLNLDDDKKTSCADEVLNPPAIEFDSFPVLIGTDVGSDCQGKITDAIDTAQLQGKVVLLPVCDVDCVTESGANAEYRVIRIVALYLDFMSSTGNNPHDNKVQPCEQTTSPTYDD